MINKIKIKKSMANYDNVVPYSVNGINIYSVEEAIYLYYNNFKIYSEEFLNEKFIKWVLKSIGDENTVKILDTIKNQSGFYQKSVVFLSINDFYTSEEIEKISSDLFDWEKRVYKERDKIKGDKYFRENQFENAIKMYKNAIDFDLLNPIVYNNIGISYLRLKKYDKATKFLKKASELDNNNDEIANNLIQALIKTNDFSRALYHIEILGNKYIHKKIYYKGLINFYKKQYKTAIIFFRNYYLLTREDFVIIDICKCFIKTKKYNKILLYIENIKNDDEILLFEISKIFFKISNFKKAIQYIKRAISKNENNFILWLALANYYRECEEIQNAEKAIVKALKIRPQNEQILIEYAEIKKLQGNIKGYKDIIVKLANNYCEIYRNNILQKR